VAAPSSARGGAHDELISGRVKFTVDQDDAPVTLQAHGNTVTHGRLVRTDNGHWQLRLAHKVKKGTYTLTIRYRQHGHWRTISRRIRIG
jgi:hypothetical protein